MELLFESESLSVTCADDVRSRLRESSSKNLKLYFYTLVLNFKL